MATTVPQSISKRNGKIYLSIYAKPGSKKEGVMSINDEEVAVAIHAQAQNNKANASLIEFIADSLDVPKSSVKFELGGTSRTKLFSIDREMPLEDVYHKLLDNGV